MVETCELCGEPMPPGETMFKFHGYSGPCPKPPLPKAGPSTVAREIAARVWQDQEMRSIVMDTAAAESIAKIIDDVRRSQSQETQQSLLDNPKK